jgi:glucose-1-phosphate thymidylyltransferase
MKGIILAGGKATRLYPITKSVCKQLLPVYDKPMIFYPLSVLMLTGIQDILIICTGNDLPRFQDLLQDGSSLGIRLSYKVQDEPRGIAEAFLLGEGFVGGDSVCLILGDNIFYGHDLGDLLRQYNTLSDGAVIFGYSVTNPREYGVIEFDASGRVLSLEEKPKAPKSQFAVTGIYFYDSRVAVYARRLSPSPRGELEITDLNREYLRERKLKVHVLDRGYAWLDTGTYDSLLAASLFIKTIEDRQGLKIGCIEEIAYMMGYINRAQLLRLSDSMKTSYGDYLRRIAQ